MSRLIRMNPAREHPSACEQHLTKMPTKDQPQADHRKYTSGHDERAGSGTPAHHERISPRFFPLSAPIYRTRYDLLRIQHDKQAKHGLFGHPPPLAPPPCTGEGSTERPHPRPLSHEERGAQALVGEGAQTRETRDAFSESAQADFAARHPGAVSTACFIPGLATYQ